MIEAMAQAWSDHWPWLVGLAVLLEVLLYGGAALWIIRRRRRRQDALKDVLATMWLYPDWYYVTKNMTTPQRELWADIIDEHHREQDPGNDYRVERWWRLTPTQRGPRRPNA